MRIGNVRSLKDSQYNFSVDAGRQFVQNYSYPSQCHRRKDIMPLTNQIILVSVVTDFVMICVFF